MVLVEISQLSVGSPHIATEVEGDIKAVLPREKYTYECIELIAVVAVINFITDRIAL